MIAIIAAVSEDMGIGKDNSLLWNIPEDLRRFRKLTLGNNVIMVNSSQLAGEVIIEDWAILSGLVLVHQFVHIGAHVMIAGGSKVGKDVPPFIKAGREPLSYEGINSIGLRRRNFSNEKIRELQDIYRYIYQKGLNTSQAVEIIEAEMPATAERDEILLFIKDSKRGIIRGYFPD